MTADNEGNTALGIVVLLFSLLSYKHFYLFSLLSSLFSLLSSLFSLLSFITLLSSLFYNTSLFSLLSMTADNEGNTALGIAVLNGRLAVVKYLVEEASPSACLETRNNAGTTPFLEAIRKGHDRIVEYLMDKGAVHGATAAEGFTPLMIAAINGKLTQRARSTCCDFVLDLLHVAFSRLFHK